MSHNNKKRLPSSPEEWMSHANSDLSLAKIGQGNKDVLPEQICFHTQQAVEKALKAVLLFSNIDFPFTHDLEELVSILKNEGILFPPSISDVGILTPYAVEARYPGYLEEISEDEVEETISLAEKVLKWASEFISKE